MVLMKRIITKRPAVRPSSEKRARWHRRAGTHANGGATTYSQFATCRLLKESGRDFSSLRLRCLPCTNTHTRLQGHLQMLTLHDAQQWAQCGSLTAVSRLAGCRRSQGGTSARCHSDPCHTQTHNLKTTLQGTTMQGTVWFTYRSPPTCRLPKESGRDFSSLFIRSLPRTNT